MINKPIIRPPSLNKISIPDRIFRELRIIDNIFKAQFHKSENEASFPFLRDKSGYGGIDGRYIAGSYILSDVELFNIQLYKDEITKRFETTANLSLITNQLKEIRNDAIKVRDFYNDRLTKSNTIVSDFLNQNIKLNSSLDFQAQHEFLEFHRAVIRVSNYELMEIYVGLDFDSNNNFINRFDYTYNYLSDNGLLAFVCQNLIDFIDRFNLSEQSHSKQTASIMRNKVKFFEIEIRDNGTIPAYLKVYLKGDADFPNVAAHLGNLYSVKIANVTDQKSGKKDLTIYPEKAYSIDEVKDEVALTLKSYFEHNPVDPSFITNTISAISETAYFQIIDYIIQLGKNLESFKELNEKFDEERYRDYFIPFLNSISTKHSAKGEVFNREGKTDIIVFDNNGNNIFIAECKLWKGEKYLIDAIDQLIGKYVNWRDEKLAIIIFNRDVKKFSNVIETAVVATQNHKQCLKFIRKRKDTSFSYVFKHPNDDKKTLLLELILFNFS
jgi:hypothetical protein